VAAPEDPADRPAPRSRVRSPKTTKAETSKAESAVEAAPAAPAVKGDDLVAPGMRIAAAWSWRVACSSPNCADQNAAPYSATNSSAP
jgi:hypothetical protein